MPTVPGLLAFLALGAAGSVHCVGMCGGFALAVSASAGGDRRRALLRELAFVAGKALTYAVLGLLVANVAGLLAPAAALRVALAWIAGGVMVAFGLAQLGLRLPRWRLPGSEHLAGTFRNLAASVRALGGTAGAFGTGMVTGFLPCGLSWSAFALATQVDPLTAFLGLLTFGLATAPALVLLGCGLLAVPARARVHALRAAGVLLVGFGLLTIGRGGLSATTTLAGDPDAGCCPLHAATEEHAGR